MAKVLSPTSTLPRAIIRGDGLKRKKSSLKDFRVTILGDRDVGKTALVVRFITRRYIVDYDKGSDCWYKHEMIVDQDTVLFDILDSSSPITLNIKRFDFASHVTDLFIVVYSTTDRNSFLYVRNLLKHLVQLKGSPAPLDVGEFLSDFFDILENGIQSPAIAIIGNKNDLVHLRQVTTEEGETLITEYSELFIGYFGELSVADQQVHPVFSEIYRWCKRHKVQINTTLKPPIAISPDFVGKNGGSGKSSPNIFRDNNNNNQHHHNTNNDYGSGRNSRS